MSSLLSHLRIVLVGSLYAGNVGACARVAANFDVRSLWIVAPACDWQGGEAQLYAKGPARRYLTGAKQVATLAEALVGCTTAVGFTRRSGELRRGDLGLAKLSGRADEITALVFGREDAGLTHEELLLCNQVCTLATSEVMPSMNLSHAVAAVVARLYEEALTPANGAAQSKAGATLREIEELFTQWHATMIDARMTAAGNPDRMLAHMRRALQRAQLTSREVGIFRGFLNKTQVALTRRKRVKS